MIIRFKSDSITKDNKNLDLKTRGEAISVHRYKCIKIQTVKA